MRTPRRFLDPAWLMFGTDAARGLRDAALDYPREHECVEYRAPLRPAEEVRGGEALPGGPARRGYLLGHYEAERVRIGEESIDREEGRMEARRRRLWVTARARRHALEVALRAHRAAYRRHAAMDLRGPSRLLPGWSYPLLVVALAVIEYVVNRTVFLVMVSDWESWIAAATPAVCIPLLAHGIGLAIRQWPTGGRGRGRLAVATAIATVCVACGVAALAYLRTVYLEQTAALSSAAAAFSAPGAGAPAAAPGLGRGVEAMVLVALNLMFLGAGVLLSGFVHDSDRDLEDALADRRRAARGLRAAWRGWIRVARRHDALVARWASRRQELQDHTLTALHEYRYYNSRFRSGPLPSWFCLPLDRGLFRARADAPWLDPDAATLDDLLAPSERPVAAEPGEHGDEVDRSLPVAPRGRAPDPAPDLPAVWEPAPSGRAVNGKAGSPAPGA